MAGGTKRQVSAQSRTTETHAWKPPEGGTVSKARAARWTGGEPSKPSSPIATKRVTTNKSSKKAASPKHQKNADPPSDDDSPRSDDEGVDLSTEAMEEWFPAALDAARPTPGGLLAYSLHGKAKPGMTNIPQNDEVKKKCLAYLQTRGVQASLESKARTQRSSRMVLVAAAASPKSSRWHQCNPSIQGITGKTSRVCSGDASATTGVAGTMQEQALEDSSETIADVARQSGKNQVKAPPPGGNPRGNITPRKLSVFEQLKEELKEVVAPLQPTERELSRWERDLKMLSRTHGFTLDKKASEDLAIFKMYHNKLSRTVLSPHKQQLVRSSSSPAAQHMHSTCDTMCQSSGSLQELGSLMRPPLPERKPPPPDAWKRRLVALGDQSPTRLKSLAHALTEGAGPNKLEYIARHANVSVLTGASFASTSLSEPWSRSSPKWGSSSPVSI